MEGRYLSLALWLRFSANRLKVHDGALRPGSKAHGHEVAWAQAHVQLLHALANEHLEGVLETRRMPSVETHQFRRDTQPFRRRGTQRRQRGNALRIVNLPQ